MRVWTCVIAVLAASVSAAMADPACISAEPLIACDWGSAGIPFVSTLAKWAKQPTAADFQAAYPPNAHGAAMVDLQCLLGNDGMLQGCQVVIEAPRDQGFGKAALSLTHLFQAEAVQQGAVSFTVQFRHAGESGVIAPENCIPPDCILEPRPPKR